MTDLSDSMGLQLASVGVAIRQLDASKAAHGTRLDALALQSNSAQRQQVWAAGLAFALSRRAASLLASSLSVCVSFSQTYTHAHAHTHTHTHTRLRARLASFS